MCNEWHDRSFFLELKPRAELASLFVDCPPNGNEEDNKENFKLDMVRVRSHSVEIGLPVGIEIPSGPVNRFSARIADLCLSPQSVCTPTWADNHRLFMCKVHAEAENMPLVPKAFHRLAKDMSGIEGLDEFVQLAGPSPPKPIKIKCNQCNGILVDSLTDAVTLASLPSDDFLSTSPAMDYFCRDSCGAQCDPHRHNHSGRSDDSKACSDWLPNPEKMMLSHSYIVLHKDTIDEKNNYTTDGKTIRCTGCNSELGTEVRNRNSMMMFHHAVVTLSIKDTTFVEQRYVDRSMLFAQLILSSCEQQSSLKLVVRSLDRTPHLLVWLLDSYVVLASGDLHSSPEGNEAEGEEALEVHPFPAIKMLYKVFDAQTAASDPRANGEDASVGLLDVPLGCCMQVVESLLRSSHALPPACRSVGQFYVGFLKIAENI